MLDSAEQIEHARAHLTGDGQRQLAAILGCELERLDAEVARSPPAPRAGRSNSASPAMCATARNDRYAFVHECGRDFARAPWAKDIARLRCMRGIDTLTAVGLCAEITDFDRFEHPKLLMSYVGLVASEKSSGQTRRQGAITKSGSQHARRLLVEAAWHYRRPPRLRTRLKARHIEQPAAVIAIAWKAQQRLHHIWRRLDTQRGKRKTIVAAGVARHLTGFCWAIVTADAVEHTTT